MKLQLIITLFILIAIGALIYFSLYRKKEKPKVGIKRDRFSDYIKDYFNLKLYTASIFLILFGIVILIAILIIDMIYS